MRTGLKWGAAIALGLLVLPVFVVAHSNALLIVFIYWALSYFVFSRAFPARKKDSVPVLSVVAALIAWLIYRTVNVPALQLQSLGDAAILLIVWATVFHFQSRWSAGLLLAYMIVNLVVSAFALLNGGGRVDDAEVQALAILLIMILIGTKMYAALLAFLFMTERKAEPVSASA